MYIVIITIILFEIILNIIISILFADSSHIYFSKSYPTPLSPSKIHENATDRYYHNCLGNESFWFLIDWLDTILLFFCFNFPFFVFTFSHRHFAVPAYKNSNKNLLDISRRVQNTSGNDVFEMRLFLSHSKHTHAHTHTLHLPVGLFSGHFPFISFDITASICC